MRCSLSSSGFKFALAIALMVSLVCFSVVKPVTAAEPPIKIGIIMPITGPGGFMGTPMKEAATAIFEGINAKGGINGRKVEYIIEDDQSSPTKAVIAAAKLIRDEKVCVIIGATMNDSNAAIIPTVEQEQIPMLVSGPLVAPYKKWVFHLGPGDERGAAHIMDFVVNHMGAKKIALMRDTAAYGSEGSKFYNLYAKKYPGVSVIIDEKMEVSDTNVVPQLTKIKAAKPDVMIVHALIPGPVAKNYKQLGMTTPVFGSHSMPTPQFLQQVGTIAEENKWAMTASKVMIAEKLPMNDSFRKNVYEPFKKMLKDKYGPSKEVNTYHPSIHDASMVAVEALKLAGTDNRAALRDAIEKVKFEGMVGNYACSTTDHQCCPRDSMPEMMVKGGEFVPYSK
jgi:branched-chain amino acid transport system substrate-binding protein